MSEELSVSFLLLSTDKNLLTEMNSRLSKKNVTVSVCASFEDALKHLEKNKVSHLMIDVTFTAFDKAKFLKNIKSVAIIAPRIKTLSFKDLINKMGPDLDRFVVTGSTKKEDKFAQEVQQFISGDKLDVSTNFSQLYKNELKTFAQFGQVPTKVEFLEMTKTGMIVLSDEKPDPDEIATIKIENFMNKKGSVLEITAKIAKFETENKGYFVELELSPEFIQKWNVLYDEYVERQLEIDEFLYSQKY